MRLRWLLAIVIGIILTLPSLPPVDFVFVDIAKGDEPPESEPEAYHYWYAPENSFGIQETKTVNWSYFWSLFKQYSAWQMEGWNPQIEEWQDNFQGTNLNEWLNISKIRSENNESEKITLNFTSPYTTKYRFTFGIDVRVKQYVNRSSQHEYTLTYPANATEDYVVSFNWSDVIPMVENGTISLNHGIKNVSGKDVFWFRIIGNQNLQKGKSFEVDPTFGETSVSGFSSSNYANNLRGTGGTAVNGDGTADNITVFLNGWGIGEEVTCVLYSGDGNTKIAETEEVSDSSGGGEWCIFNFAEPKPSITNNTDYLIGILSDDTVAFYYKVVGGNPYISVAATYPTFPATVTPKSGYKFALYCSYTETPPPPENTAPTQSGEAPANGTSDVSTTLTLYVICTDINSDTMTATWWSNSSGGFLAFATNSSISTGTNITQTNSNFSGYNTTYYWSVNVTDGYDWNNETYSFTTRSAIISLSINQSGYAFGTQNMSIILYSNASNPNHFGITNDGEVAIDLKIQATNMTNATHSYNWTLDDTPNADQYALACSEDGSTWTNISTDLTTFYTDLATSDTISIDLRLKMPTSITAGHGMGCTITISAIKH